MSVLFESKDTIHLLSDTAINPVVRASAKEIIAAITLMILMERHCMFVFVVIIMKRIGGEKDTTAKRKRPLRPRSRFEPLLRLKIVSTIR